MAPPSGRPAVGEQDVKPPNGMMPSSQTGEHVAHTAGEEEAEHEAEYTHDSSAYDPNTSRTAYNYHPPPVAPLSGDHAHLSPEMTGSPSHQAGSGRATPRTAAPPQPYYPPQGYQTPPRGGSSLYNVMSNDRGTSSGGTGGDVYGSQSDLGVQIQNGYAPQTVLNGAPTLKRGRDDEDELPRPGSGGLDLKRRKTMEGPIPTPIYDMPRSTTSATIARRR